MYRDNRLICAGPPDSFLVFMIRIVVMVDTYLRYASSVLRRRSFFSTRSSGISEVHLILLRYAHIRKTQIDLELLNKMK